MTLPCLALGEKLTQVPALALALAGFGFAAAFGFPPPDRLGFRTSEVV